MSETLSSFLAQFKTLIFDLDGVIIDSVELKVACMKTALSSFDSDKVNPFLRDFVHHFGRSRQAHFERFYYGYLNGRQEGFATFYEHYAERYAKALQERYAQSPLCKGAKALISKSQAALFVATGTLETEAKMVLKEKALASYFQGIFGAPLDKKNSIQKALSLSGVEPQHALMIGDAIYDRDSAMHNQVPFLFVEAYSHVSIDEMAKGASRSFYAVRTLDDSAPVITAVGWALAQQKKHGLPSQT